MRKQSTNYSQIRSYKAGERNSFSCSTKSRKQLPKLFLPPELLLVPMFSFPTSYESFRCSQYPQFPLLSHVSTARYFARPSVSSHRKGPANQVTFPLHVQTDPRCSEEGRERQTTHTKDSHQLCSQHLSCWQ